MGKADKIIEAVRARPHLYDPTLQTFKNLEIRNRSWVEVAKIVYGQADKTTVNKVKIQWKSIRDNFVKQQRKRQSSQRIGSYSYENEMQFLLPHILTKERDEQAVDKAETVPHFGIKPEPEDCVSLEEASISEDSQSESHFKCDLLPSEPPVVEEFIWDQHISNNSNNNNVREIEKEEHPVDAFFHGIAQTVKQLKPATVARVKKAVANIVMDAELEEIEGKG